ncbi:ATP-binding protein, partial [Streptomyces sp. NPDC056821]
MVGTDTLLTTRDNSEAVIEAKAMMCVYGPAGSGKTMSVNSALRHLAPNITHHLELRAGPTPRDIRHGLFQALGLPGEPPARPIEFDTLLKEALAEEFRVLVCDEAQWMKKTGFEFWRHLWDDKRTNIAVIFAGGEDNLIDLERASETERARLACVSGEGIHKVDVGAVGDGEYLLSPRRPDRTHGPG